MIRRPANSIRARVVHQDGSHQKWRLTTGASIIVIVTASGRRTSSWTATPARLKSLGATDERGAIEQRDEYWVRMNDPEENEFCVQ